MKNRHVMQLDLRSRLAQPAHAARNPRLEDRESLAHLMLAAYRGAADDEGETIAEALQEVDSVLVSAETIERLMAHQGAVRPPRK